MWERLLRQASRQYGPAQRLGVLALAGIVFVIVLPLTLLSLGRRLDRRLGRPAPLGPGVRGLGGFLALAGWLLGLWANYVQFTQGRGTPVPVMATQELLVGPPYAYCRNPMALGTILAYLGLAVAAGSRGASLLVAPGAAALLAYIKLVEERELAARFGEAYLGYRCRAPFLVPGMGGRC